MLFGSLDAMVYSFQHRHHINPTAFIIDGPSLHMPLGNTAIIQKLTIPGLTVYHCLARTEKLRSVLEDDSTYIFFLTLMFLGTMAQTFHAYSHMPGRTNKFIRFLQYFHIILPPHVHKAHHVVGKYSYAIMNGWSNPVVDRLFDSVFEPLMLSFPSHFHFEEEIWVDDEDEGGDKKFD